MYVLSILSFSLSEMSAWYIILLKLHLFPSGLSFYNYMNVLSCIHFFRSILFINFFVIDIYFRYIVNTTITKFYIILFLRGFKMFTY